MSANMRVWIPAFAGMTIKILDNILSHGYTSGSLFCLIHRQIAAGGELAAPVAQLVEHVLGKDEASGSIPLGGFLTKPNSSVTP